MTRLEPMLFVRFGADEGFLRWLQVQASGGLTGVPKSTYTVDYSNPREFEYSFLRESRLFLAVSVIFYPHLLIKPKPKE